VKTLVPSHPAPRPKSIVSLAEGTQWHTAAAREDCGGERWALADFGEGAKRRTGQRICYPCQTCLPQAHWTVSVGFCLVSCCVQTGQGLVITYVIAVTSQGQASLPQHACRIPKDLTCVGQPELPTASVVCPTSQVNGTRVRAPLAPLGHPESPQ